MIVEGGLAFGEREHRPLRWPCFSLLTRGTLQIRIQFIRQRSDPTLEQTNKQIISPVTQQHDQRQTDGHTKFMYFSA